MKKLFILIAFFVLCKVGYGQSPIGDSLPVKQSVANSPSTIMLTNALNVKGGVQVGHFVDTSAANLSATKCKYYPYALITTDTNVVWFRSYDAKKWIQVIANNPSPTGDTLVWSMRGNTVGSRQGEPVLGTLDPYPINFITNGLQRLIIPTGGITRYSSSSTKCLTYDTLTHQMYYYDCSGGGGGVTTLTNGLTLSGSTGKLGGTLTEGTSIDADGNTFQISGSGSLGGNVYIDNSDLDLYSQRIGASSEIRINPDSITINTHRGTFYIDTLNSQSNASDSMMVWTKSGVSRGAVGIRAIPTSGGSSGRNIYNTDSTLASNRTVTGAGRTLKFLGLGGMTVTSGTTDSLTARLSYAWNQNPLTFWIVNGSTTTITPNGTRTRFASGTASSDYLSGNPKYYSGDNYWFVDTVVAVTKNSTSYGFSIGQLGTPASLLAKFNLSDTAGYITLSASAGGTPFASNRGLETFIWSAGDTLYPYLKRYGTNIVAGIINRRTGQDMSLSYQYKLSYPTTVVEPNASLPVLFLHGGTWDFYGSYLFLPKDNKYPDILFAGNSITAGMNGANYASSWPNVATAGLTGNISLHGQPGQDIDGALNNIDEFVNLYSAYYYFLNYGVNNLNGGMSAATFISKYKILTDSIKAHGKPIVIINITPQATDNTVYNDTLRNFAAREGFGYIDISTPLKNPSGVNMNPLYTDDNIHPNTLGQQIFGEVVRQYITQNNLTLTPLPYKVYPLPLQPNPLYLTGIDENNNLVKVPTATNLGNADLTQTSDTRTYTYTDKALSFLSGNSFVIKSTSSVAMTDPGAGSVFLFYPKQSATRAGYVTGTQNQPDSLGQYSFGGGYNTSAPGTYGMTYGLNLSNRAAAATAFGNGNTITSAANYAITAGFNNFLVGQSAAVFGSNNKADAYSLVAGNTNEGLNGYCFVAGHDNKANGNTSATIGANLTVVGNGSQAYGQYYNDNGGFVSTFIGDATNDPFTADAHKRLFLRFLNGYKFMLTTSGAVPFEIKSTGVSTFGGSVEFPYVSKAVDYTATAADYTIEVTVTGKTITLPTAVGITGRTYTIKLTASGTGTVATTSSQNIDGSTTYSLASQYKYVTVQSTGSSWIVIANN